MGLDMYLLAVESKENEQELKSLEELTGQVVHEYAYYRKMNALQGYFVEKFDIQNCGMVKLDRETIDELYEILEEIRMNREKAPFLLPTFSGPFFGSYDYDRTYHNYIDEAHASFHHAKFLDFDKYDLYFTSNW